MPDIEIFWSSLKMAWSRRLMSSSCLWQQILELNLLYINHDMSDIQYGGPTLLKQIAAEFVTHDLHFAHPYFFYKFNIFDNPLFSTNEVELKSSNLLPLWNKRICQVGDFFYCTQSPPVLLTLTQFNRKFNLSLNFLNYHRIKSKLKKQQKI